MLDVPKLEQRWLKYKLKRSLPYVGGLFLFIGLMSVVIWIFDKPSSESPAETNSSTVKVSDTSAIPSSANQENTILEPSMEFIQTIDGADKTPEEAPFSPQKTVSARVVKPSPSELPIPENKNLELPETQSPTPAASPPKRLKDSAPLAINRNESKIDIAELQKRFKETSNPNLGLFIARYQYDHGEYAEAYNYALKTNAINSHLDESWLIFAKSLVKIGKIDQAKKTLQAYISESNSNAARVLLDSIERGSFK